MERDIHIRAYSDKPDEELDDWLKGGFWSDRNNRRNVIRPEVIRSPKSLFGGELRITTPSGKEEVFNPAKEYDYSKLQDLKFIGKISGTSAFSDPIVMEKIKYLMGQGIIGIVPKKVKILEKGK